MLRKSLWSLALSSALVAACGGDDSTTGAGDSSTPATGGDAGVTYDASVDSGNTLIDAGTDAGGGMAITQLKTGMYTVSNVVKITDDCGLTLEKPSVMFNSLLLTNTGTTIALGTFYGTTATPPSVTTFDPAGYALGSNGYSDAGAGVTSLMATLMVDATVTFTDDMCSTEVMRTSLVTITANNSASVDYTDTETNQSSKCTADNGESTKTCTSHYTFDLNLPE